MPRTILIPTRFTGPWARAGLILLAGGMVAATSTFVGPASTNATTVNLSDPASRSAAAERLASVREAAWPAYLGSLTGARHTVEVYVARNGPLYTVKDLEGRTLASQINSDEVYARFPDLNLGDSRGEALQTSDTAAER